MEALLRRHRGGQALSDQFGLRRGLDGDPVDEAGDRCDMVLRADTALSRR
ncbi:hypothetical protein [Nonomuraea sp. NPDC050691]